MLRWDVVGFEDRILLVTVRVQVRNLLARVSWSFSGGQRVKLGGTLGLGGGLGCEAETWVRESLKHNSLLC